MKNISVIIPAYNEADRLDETLRAVLTLPGIQEVIVVDDGSTDETARVAREAGATLVIRHPRRLGKGKALQTGCQAAKGDYLLFLDADLGDSAREAVHLFTPVLSGEAEVALAGFPQAGKTGGFGIVLRFARWAVRKLGGKEVESPLSGQRFLHRQVYASLPSLAPGYGVETAMTIDLLRKGFRLVEVPTQMKHRALGRHFSGFLHRGKQFRDIVFAILVRIFRR